MIRIVPVLLALSFAALPALADPAPKPMTTVDAAVIRLGDIFSDAGARADDTVAAAPAPGMRMTVGADWLAATARAHRLDWHPASGYEQTVIVRATRSVGADQVEQQLMAAIAAQQPVEDATLQLDNPGLQLNLPASAPDRLAIDGLTVDPRSGRVTAYVGGEDAPRLRVTGRLVFEIAVPMLNRPLAPGATIAPGDLDRVKMRRDRVGPDTALDADQVVGKTPRRPLAAGQPLRMADLQLPVLVHKRDLVSMSLATERLALTTQAQALEDGAKGEVIRVSNTKSNRVIEAIVTGADTVVARMPAAAPTPARLAPRLE